MSRGNLITLFVYNIPISIHCKGLWALFRYHENIIDDFILEKKSKNGKRFGFVRFSKILDAQREISRINGFVIMARESLEVGSIIKSELDLSPEGRLNDWEEKVNVPYIKKDGNGKRNQKIWVDAINEEDNFLSHNGSIPVEGDATDVLMDRANEDISSMFLSMEMDQNEGLEIQIKEGMRVGLSEQVRQISDKEWNPSSKEK
ncbi:hypothetical protein Goshw_013192 [Gossypium schwendimanii]|uniref:RRM domain-containing protein n=1 Tax=Gossypium schwendimanii TaxID=34291 RepID=A0A7J9L9M2_GOSSC|nr:hypothetical protein [Gossypium schwendimanii]